jgi:hypothetical protein
VDLHLDLGGLEDLDGWAQFDFFLFCLMALGQVLFVMMWFVLPWWKEWVGRALMVKGSTLALLLLMTIVNTMLALRGVNYKYMQHVQALGYVAVTIGIWSQVLALRYEIRKGNVEDVIHAIRHNTTPRRVQRFRPLLWLGISTAGMGFLWLLLSSWDVLALLATSIGLGLAITHYSITRPVALEPYHYTEESDSL